MTPSSFKCPECGKQAVVVNVRRFRRGTCVKRRWECECGLRFNTLEFLAAPGTKLPRTKGPIAVSVQAVGQ